MARSYVFSIGGRHYLDKFAARGRYAVSVQKLEGCHRLYKSSRRGYFWISGGGGLSKQGVVGRIDLEQAPSMKDLTSPSRDDVCAAYYLRHQ